MTKWTIAKRKALDKQWFGEPETSLFPVQDQGDLDSAAHLIGKAKNPEAVKRRLISIAHKLGLKIPDAWQSATMAALTTVTLPEGVTAADDVGMVRRTGLLTKPGDFPAHDWSLSAEELKASAERFPGNGFIEIEHLQSHGKATILDGHTGYLDGVWASEDGDELYGDLLLPEWLDAIASANGGKLSAVFDRETKDLKGVGLVLEPAVPEAAMLSAFVDFAKRHDTPHGQMAMQDLHDSAARHGSTCSASNVGMASKHEASAIQQVHDLATSHGAKCAALGSIGGSMVMYSNEDAYRNGTVVSSSTVVLSGTPAVVEAPQQEDRTVPENKTTPDGSPSIADLQAALAAEKAEREAEKAEREADRKALVTLQAERRVEKADLWVDKLVVENKILPAERPLLVKLHVMCATDDDTSGLVTLADGGRESRLATLLAALQARQVIGLTKEQIAANPKVTVLLNRQATQEAEDAERGTDEDNDKLLAMTPTGRDILASRRRMANGRS